MDKNENIIPQIIYLIFFNINYSNIFYKSRIKFKIYILLFTSLWYMIFYINAK